MPRIDGLTLTSLTRKESELPIILLSAKGEPSDRAIGLRVGADDYMAKPFDVEELVARVHIVLRRADARNPAEIGKTSTRASAAHTRRHGEGNEDLIRFGHLVVDFRNQDIWLKDRRLSLTPSEFRLLVCLARNAGRTVTRETLWQSLGRGTKAMSRTLGMHIWRLREKMLVAAPDSPVIETIRGFGYRLRPAADKLTEAGGLYERGE